MNNETLSNKPSLWKAVLAIVKKDLAAEYRSRELISSMLVFAVLIVVIFNYALDLEPSLRAKVTGGVLWVTFAFAGTIGLNRSMAVEKDRGCLDGLLLAPVDRSAIFFGKAISTLIFMLTVELFMLPIYGLFYNTNLFNPSLMLTMLLGSIGYVSVGTLLSSMAVQTRTRDILLPILLFPVVVPILLIAVSTSNSILAGEMEGVVSNLGTLFALGLLFTAMGYMVFEYVVEE